MKFYANVEPDCARDGYRVRMARRKPDMPGGIYIVTVSEFYQADGIASSPAGNELFLSRDETQVLFDAMVKAGMRPTNPVQEATPEILKVQRAHLDDMRYLTRGLLRKLGVEMELEAQMPKVDDLGSF